MGKRRQGYVSYLVRMWRPGEGEPSPWHASVECPLTGEHRGFANLQDLFAFLEDVTSQNVEEESPDDQRST